jgi:hypothetical protein
VPIHARFSVAIGHGRAFSYAGHFTLDAPADAMKYSKDFTKVYLISRRAFEKVVIANSHLAPESGFDWLYSVVFIVHSLMSRHAFLFHLSAKEKLKQI